MTGKISKELAELIMKNFKKGGYTYKKQDIQKTLDSFAPDEEIEIAKYKCPMCGKKMHFGKIDIACEDSRDCTFGFGDDDLQKFTESACYQPDWGGGRT